MARHDALKGKISTRAVKAAKAPFHILFGLNIPVVSLSEMLPFESGKEQLRRTDHLLSAMFNNLGPLFDDVGQETHRFRGIFWCWEVFELLKLVLEKRHECKSGRRTNRCRLDQSSCSPTRQAIPKTVEPWLALISLMSLPARVPMSDQRQNLTPCGVRG